MTTEQMPPLPTIAYGRVIDGVPAMTVEEHTHQMHAYARAYAAQEVEKEREACAKVCDEKGISYMKLASDEDLHDERAKDLLEIMTRGVENCADAIRARGAA